MYDFRIKIKSAMNAFVFLMFHKLKLDINNFQTGTNVLCKFYTFSIPISNYFVFFTTFFCTKSI